MFFTTQSGSNSTSNGATTRRAYRGTIVTAYETFSYIADVTKADGEAVATNGDVFVPEAFESGTVVEFDELNTDPKREGKFRTEKARVLSEECTALTLTQPTELAVPGQSTRLDYHRQAKVIDPELLAKATANQPFAGLEKFGLGISQPGNFDRSPEAIRLANELALAFLRQQFAFLNSIGVNFTFDDGTDLAEEEQKITEQIAGYRELGMENQAAAAEQEYESFCNLRKVLTSLKSSGHLSMQHMLPVNALAEISVAFPVWYWGGQELEDTTKSEDPRPSVALQHICDAVGTQQFANWLQMWNRRTRLITSFDSNRDLMPPRIVEAIRLANQIFDYVVIATPYHDIASHEWADLNWLRLIDPLLIGFKKEVPDVVFVIDRWSGTGMLPLFVDCVADTMSFLELHKSGLKKFKSDTYWHKTPGIISALSRCVSSEGLHGFAEECLRMYEEGRLFDFLRGSIPQQALTAES